MEVIGGQLHRLASQPPRALGLAFLRRPRHLAVERQCRDEGAVRRAEHRLRRDREARLLPAQRHLAAVHLRAPSSSCSSRSLASSSAGRLQLRRPRAGRRARWSGCCAGRYCWSLMVVGLALLYRYGPSRASARWQWISWGSASRRWLDRRSMLFSWYVAEVRQLQRDLRFARRGDRLHDLDLAVDHRDPVGAEINAETEHQTARDTTIGGDKPMGRRGAVTADTLGKTKPWRGKNDHSVPVLRLFGVQDRLHLGQVIVGEMRIVAAIAGRSAARRRPASPAASCRSHRRSSGSAPRARNRTSRRRRRRCSGRSQ